MARQKSGKDRITKADKTRARLIQVATRLFQEHGSDEVTVCRIAAAAKIEAGSIYYHFASHEQILRAVLERGVGNARDGVFRPPSPRRGPTACPWHACVPRSAPISSTRCGIISRRA